ncbi:MAG: ATP-binding protein [Thalassobaculum sp.]|uniref:hybrid sensor histidine kinase/response regulator n=1 Tax=Thalassobaculum sp. TaxID=2022740 RepID=UPI0032EF49BD
MLSGRTPNIIIFSLMISGILATNYYVFFPLKNQIIDRELVHIDATVRNIARLTQGRLQIVELLLDNSARVLLESDITARRAHDTLRTSAEAVPLVRVIGMFATDGTVRYSSRSVVPPAVNLAERDYIAHWIRGGAGERYLSGPVQNAVDGLWQISMSKPMIRDGKLAGIISAVINVNLLGVASHVSPDNADYLTLLDSRFTLIDRFPARPGDVGGSLANAELFRAVADSTTGVVSGTFVNVFTGEARIAVAHRFFDGNLVISSSRPLASVLHYWKQLAVVTAGISALLLVMIVAVVLAIRRDAHLRRAHARHLEALNVELKSRTDDAERLARVKSDFLATMSHEIRTPLTAIMGMHDLCRNAQDIATVRRHLGVAEGASRVLLGIINDILDSERLESGRLTLESIPFGLAAVAEQALATIRPQADDKGLALTLDLPPESVKQFVGDPMRLSQILINLLGNAVKFTDTGNVNLAVRTVGQGSGRHIVHFDVTDTGPGIPADKQNLLFQPFEQIATWRARSSGGSGLGLSICKRLVDAMKGRIGVDSSEGSGSRFWFEIELPEHASADVSELATPAVADRSDPTEILVVDDNAINRDLINEMLTAYGHHVEVASSGRAAIELARKRQFDVILLDIQMPEMNGIDVIRQLRQDRLVEGTSIIALTANAMREQVEEYVSEGFDGCAAKPIVWPDLLDMIASARRQRRAPETMLSSNPIDWRCVESVSAILGNRKALEMLVDAIERATVLSEGIADDQPDAALADLTHSMRGFLGNLGIVEVPDILLRYEQGLAGPDRATLRRRLIEALNRARREVASHLKTNGRMRDRIAL